MSMPPGLREPWEWIQPLTIKEILSRLRVARDCRVPERERENLCSVAHETIEKLLAERTEWKRLAEEIYGRHAYPDAPHLRLGSLDAMYEKRLGRESLT